MSDDGNEPPWARGLPRPPPWKDAGGRTVYENPWLRLTEHEAVAPTGAPALYAVMRPANLAVGVLPIHEDGTVTLVGQSRFACADFSWEMPEGGAPFEEDPLDGIKRELAEEAGLKAEHWLPALRLQTSNSVTDERALTWLCWGLSSTPVAPDPTEVIVTARTPFLTLLEAIGKGQVQDALTVATTLRAYHMARESLLPAWLAHVMLHRL
ncbi:MAG: NUDIX hydrolase [Brevundimonas sp.]|uniref:NUDIX domain-containing protein n=1 Tax=Brevundimonas sp. TaxID=1871086 RepID=UPI0025BAFEBB|nr:NUDIX hydrolase [Brevundimonas sp.]MBX3478438.1 NUDIX hydrolase [Brevundimonas sp.]